MCKTINNTFLKLKNYITAKPELTIFIIMFVSMIIRSAVYGFNYYFQLDDYIQYFNYPSSLNYAKLIFEQGFLASRPLAGIFDIYVWSNFTAHMFLSVILISFMFAVSGVILLKIFNRFFGTGYFFIIFYMLFPANFEGTYWLSASSRIVTALFFMSLSLLMFQLFCDKNNGNYLTAYFIFTFLSYAFYEQVLVLSFTASIVLMIMNFRSYNLRVLSGLWNLPAAAIYFIITSIFKGSGGAMASRMSVILPISSYYYKVFLPDITSQVKTAFFDCSFFIFFKGFIRGIKFIITDKLFIFLILTFILSISVFFLTKKGVHLNNEGIKFKYAVLPVGIILLAAPVSIFFFISNSYFSMRALVPCYVGISLLLDFIIRLICRNKNIITASVCTVFFFICLIASVSEIHDYKVTYDKDQIIADTIITSLQDNQAEKIGIININKYYPKDQNYPYKEHISSVASSNWALYGLLAHKSSLYPYEPIPINIDNDVIYEKWNCQHMKIDSFDSIYYFDDKNSQLLPLYVEKNSETDFSLYFSDGSLFAQTHEDENSIGYIKLAGSLN